MAERFPMRLLALSVMPVLMLSGTAGAVGPVSITQAGALAGGITPGDTPGFPVTISEPGSYRLDSNLVLTTAKAGTSAVTITANDVTLDLNGFQIDGGARCLEGAMYGNSCSGPISGMYLVHSQGNGVTIRNGSIRGSSGAGVFLSGESSLESLRVSMNIGNGIEVWTTKTYSISDTSVTLSGNGIFSESHGTLKNVRSTYNNNYGIYATKGTIVDVVSSFNAGTGVLPGFSTVERAYAQENGVNGIWGGSVVRDSAARGNAGIGFKANTGTIYISDYADGNGSHGFDLAGSPNCYSNLFANGNGGTQILGGTAFNGTKVTCP